MEHRPSGPDLAANEGQGTSSARRIIIILSFISFMLLILNIVASIFTSAPWLGGQYVHTSMVCLAANVVVGLSVSIAMPLDGLIPSRARRMRVLFGTRSAGTFVVSPIT